MKLIAQSKRVTAFTLTELLVVILIVIILGAILFPVFVKVKRKSKEVVCISHLRQHYLSLQLYRNDFGDYAPRSWDWKGFEPYLEKDIICTEKAKGAIFESTNGYTLLAGFLSGEDGPAQHDRLQLIECREKRGPEIPLITDNNHGEPIVDGMYSEREDGFWIVLRESGQVERLSNALVNQRQGDDSICNHPIPDLRL